MMMRNVMGLPVVLFLSLVAGAEMPRAASNGPSADTPPAGERYYPPPESAGGWRRCKNAEEIRKLADMDPQKLAVVGRENHALYGGPWALLVIRYGYIAGEWMGVPAMPQTTFDVWSCTKSATGIAYGLLIDDSRNHQLPKHVQIDLDSQAYAFVPEGYPQPSGSMPMWSLTAQRNFCLHPRYLKCAAAHFRYLGCRQRLKNAANDRIGIEPEEDSPGG
jgi:hypothetical protein